MPAAIPASHYLIVSLLLFGIGVVGVLVRRNAIVIMMSIELILNAANINFVAFSGEIMAMTGAPNHVGQIFPIFVVAVGHPKMSRLSTSAAGGRRYLRHHG